MDVIIKFLYLTLSSFLLLYLNQILFCYQARGFIYFLWNSHLKLFLIVIQAARETGALQAAKNKLEKQVEELTWRLQLEKRMRVHYL